MTPLSTEQQAQERQYRLPYHYVPRHDGQRIVYALSVDWAGSYLASIALAGQIVDASHARSIVDIGCGDGRITNELAGRFPERSFVGLDLSARAIALAEALRVSENVKFVAGPLGSAAVPADQDLGLLIEVLEHIPLDATAVFLRQALGLVRPGGELLITVPHANRPLQRKHYQHFTGASLQTLLTEALGPEMASVDVQFFDANPGPFTRFLARVARNRWFTLEPLFQRELRRQARLVFVPEHQCGRVMARVTRRC
jgi:SAM-dependent methyltransferase